MNAAVVNARTVDLAVERAVLIDCTCSPADPADCCPRCTVVNLLVEAERYEAARLPW